MTDEIIIINFDAVLDEQGKLKILEPGPGLNRVGYSIGNNDPNRKKVRENIVESILRVYKHVYIVTFNKNARYLLPRFDLSDAFLAQHKDAVTFYDIAEIIKNKNALRKDAIIICSVPANAILHTPDMVRVLKQEGINLPFVNSSLIFYGIQDKPSLAYMIGKFIPELIPDQMHLNFDDENAVTQALTQIKSEYVILKPLDATRAKGIVLIPREKLKAVVTWLAIDNPAMVTMMRELVGEDKELQEKLLQLKIDKISLRVRTCIVQAYIPPKTITLSPESNKSTEVSFRPTIRFVVMATYNTQTHNTTVSFVDAYYKLPEKPITDGKINWGSCISYSQINRQMQWADNPMMTLWEKLSEKPTSNNSQINVFPSFVELSDADDREAVKKQIQKLIPMFHYLFTTNYYQFCNQVFSEKYPYATLLKEFTKYSVDHELDEKICEMFKFYGLNVAQILVQTFYFILQKQQQAAISESLIPTGFFAAFSRFAYEFGSRKNSGFTEMQEFSKLTLVNFSSELKKLYLTHRDDRIEIILQRFSVGCFDAPGPEFYQRGIFKFKETKYSDATQLLESAVTFFPENSIEAATCFYSLVSCYIKQEKYAAAKNAGQKSVLLRKELLIAGKLKSEDVIRSEEKLVQATKLFEGDQHAQEGLKQFKSSNIDSAISFFKDAIKKHEEAQKESARLATYYYNLASCLHHKKDIPAAISHLQTCLNMRIKLLGEKCEVTKNTVTKLEKLTTELSAELKKSSESHATDDVAGSTNCRV